MVLEQFVSVLVSFLVLEQFVSAVEMQKPK
jgi:hypothetical protein